MYIEMNNLNQEMREWITQKFSIIDILDEELFISVLNEFDYIKSCNKKFYNQLLRTMYQDYKVISYFENRRYKDCIALSDIEEEIDDNPGFYNELLNCSFRFFDYGYAKKKEILLKSKDKFDEFKTINPSYIFDLLNFTRELTKEDIIAYFYETYEESEINNGPEKEIESLDETMDFLYNIYYEDNNNYKSIATDIINDAYLYLKDEESKRKIKKYQYKLINIIEKNSLDNLSEAIDDESDEFFTDILDSFIQYNKKSKDEQIKILNKVKGKKNK